MNPFLGRQPYGTPRGFIPRFRGGGEKGHGPRFQPCKACNEQSVEKDILAITYPVVREKKHRQHIAEAILDAPTVKSGSHGDRIVEALEWSMQKAREVAEMALASGQPRVALEALRVIGDVAANEAKIVGAIPKSKQMHVHVPAFTPEQARALLADVAATTLPPEKPALEAAVIEPSTRND